MLAVCTGNICRSPAVERLLATRLGIPFRNASASTPDVSGAAHRDGVVTASAGVGAVVGAPISPPMAELLRAAGAEPEGFVARQLTAELVRAAGLVLVLTRRHRSAVVELEPAAVRRTFTLRELARLAEGVDATLLPHGPQATVADRLRALVPLAAARRGMVASDPDLDDVIDPYRGSAACYRQSFDELEPAVDRLAALVRA
ncbi:low molecular weight phosphatase family protein [soil metagenome]